MISTLRIKFLKTFLLQNHDVFMTEKWTKKHITERKVIVEMSYTQHTIMRL